MKVHQKRLLDKGKIEKPVTAVRSLCHTNPKVVEKLRTEAEYFEKNKERMRYPTFRRQHPFAGSGVMATISGHTWMNPTWICLWPRFLMGAFQGQSCTAFLEIYDSKRNW